jgi:predicted DNA-binding protein YlxM (UPF0122 family)
MDKRMKQAMLFDFYAGLLTPRQRSIYEEAINHDLSLGEIADEEGISRQGAHDVIKRCDMVFRKYEDTLHLVEKYLLTQSKLKEIQSLSAQELTICETEDLSKVRERMEQIYRLSTELLSVEEA